MGNGAIWYIIYDILFVFHSNFASIFRRYLGTNTCLSIITEFVMYNRK